MKEKVIKQIKFLLENKELSLKELCVLNILCRFWGEKKISQTLISTHKDWQFHYSQESNQSLDTTKREVRKVIRNLRTTHKIPVLSSYEGYFLPETDKDVATYIEKLESEAKSRASSSLETYRCMKQISGNSSAFLDTIDTIGGQIVRQYF